MAAPSTAALGPRWARALLPADLIDGDAWDRSRRDRVVDAVLFGVAVLGGATLLALTWRKHPEWLLVVDVALAIASVVGLRWRRSHPGAVGILLSAATLVSAGAGAAALIAGFNAAIRARLWLVAVVADVSIAASATSVLLYPGPDGFWLPFAVGVLLTFIVLGWGLFVRARRELVVSLRDRAERAETDARAAERRRIAREMHDVLAHRLSLLSVHAGALEFRPDAPAEEVAEAAGVIRASAHAALEELRDVIGVLREPERAGSPEPEPPQPTLADVPGLVDECAAAGMRVRLDLSPPDAPLPVVAGRTAYRIVQEALTNARKHAPGAAVDVVLAAEEDGLRVEVRSRAPVGAGAPAGSLPGAGTGLVGLAERVVLAGGELAHGPDEVGAFVVRARLPLTR